MLKSLALCMGLAVVASTAQAQDYELYAEVEGWDVFRRTTRTKPA